MGECLHNLLMHLLLIAMRYLQCCNNSLTALVVLVIPIKFYTGQITSFPIWFRGPLVQHLTAPAGLSGRSPSQCCCCQSHLPWACRRHNSGTSQEQNPPRPPLQP